MGDGAIVQVVADQAETSDQHSERQFQSRIFPIAAGHGRYDLRSEIIYKDGRILQLLKMQSGVRVYSNDNKAPEILC